MVKTKDILNNLVSGYNKITPDESTEIQKIIDKYPYFQQAYLLQTIFLKQSHSFYKNILQETAARTTDRRRLYEMIEWETQKNDNNISTGDTDADIPQNTESKAVEDDSEQKNLENNEKEEDASIIVQIKEENLAPKETGKQETGLINSDTKIIEELHTESKERKDEIQVFITEDEPIEKNKLEKSKKDEKIPEKKTNSVENSVENLKTKEVKNEEETNVREKTEKTDKEEIINNKEEKKLNNDVKPEDEDNKLSYLEWLRQLNAEKKHENSQIFDAIDKFLKERPKIIPKREKSVEPPAIIEKSIEERQTLMTETLANLYIKQKKYDKAIQAFKILSLKYPKKSSYFANRIKELKQKLK